MLILFETPAGFALFKVLNEGKLSQVEVIIIFTINFFSNAFTVHKINLSFVVLFLDKKFRFCLAMLKLLAYNLSNFLSRLV
jgi:hypothetical protein